MIIFKGKNYTIVFDEFELYEVVPDYDFGMWHSLIYKLIENKSYNINIT